MAKKPKHDPLTAWSSNSAGSHLTTAHIQQAYSYLTNSTNFPPLGSWQIAAPPKPYKWSEMAVGEIHQYEEIDFEGVDVTTETVIGALGVYKNRVLVADGSEGVGEVDLSRPLGYLIRKTKIAQPAKSPDEIEETAELIIGWRTFSVENFKLRGVWSVWHERVFHASCNCKEFTAATTGSFSYYPRPDIFVPKDDLRDQMRQHLAAGRGTCGVYSRAKLSYFKDVHESGHPDRAVQVAAKVVNYGLGYEYDAGFRSEYSRLEHLYLLETRSLGTEPGGKLTVFLGNPPTGALSPETVAQTLSTTYGVPCEVMHPLEFMWKHEVGTL